MTFSRVLLNAALLLAPFFVSAQAHLGHWQWKQTTPDGATITSTMTFKEDGTYAVDFESDGTPEVMGSYSYKEGKMTIKDTSDGACKGIEAVYALTVEGNTATAKMVKDPCPARSEGNNGEAMILTRKE